MSEAYLPTEQEKQETLEATNKLLAELKQQYPAAEVALVGSLAKGTWIAKDVDADIYVLSVDWQPNYENAKQFYVNGHKKEAGTLKIWACRKYGLDIDLIFANPNDVKSDTLKHAPFFNENLSLGQKGNVIALKAFFKTEGVYGAEMGGITGVAIEELIRQHGTVEAVIEYLASNPDKPFLQDPILKESRDLLASIIPLRWKQLRNCLHMFLRFQYNRFTKEQFLSLYPKHFVVNLL